MPQDLFSQPNFFKADPWITSYERTSRFPDQHPDRINAEQALALIQSLQQSQANPAVRYAGQPPTALTYQPPTQADNSLTSVFGTMPTVGALQEAFNHMQNLREQEAEMLLERAKRSKTGRK